MVITWWSSQTLCPVLRDDDVSFQSQGFYLCPRTLKSVVSSLRLRSYLLEADVEGVMEPRVFFTWELEEFNHGT
jgi:hypothetical protein